jgi:hypothetical protein
MRRGRRCAYRRRLSELPVLDNGFLVQADLSGVKFYLSAGFCVSSSGHNYSRFRGKDMAFN